MENKEVVIIGEDKSDESQNHDIYGAIKKVVLIENVRPYYYFDDAPVSKKRKSNNTKYKKRKKAKNGKGKK